MKKSKILLIIACVCITVLVLAACAKTYTVIFDPNGGSILSGESIQTVIEGEAAIPPTPERRGYAFDGWEGQYSSVTGDATVRAKWTPLYTVTFNLDGGVADDPSLLVQHISEGNDAVLPQVSRQGYVLDGWSTDNITNIRSDLVVTARWARVWKICYQLSGGEVADDSLLEQTVRENESPTAPSPRKDAFTFVKWTEHINEAESTKTYTAVWEKTKYTAAEISKLANAATVEITTYRPSGEEWALGSGFFINDSGLLVTNYHVAKESSVMKVKVDDNTTYYVSHVVDYNEKYDVAVLQVLTRQKTPYLTLSTKQPTVGDTVYAVGSSLGLTGTFSSGIVSYVGRQIDDVKFIQTTAPISSGNSGGPLISEYGEVVGMNTATYTEGQNLNLAIPSTSILSVNNYTQRISLDDWFGLTVEYYFHGDVVIPVQDNPTICTDGYTYKGKTGTSSQVFISNAQSSQQILMFSIKLNDYDQRDMLRYDIIAARTAGSTVYYDKFTPSLLATVAERQEDNSVIIIGAFQIPKNYFNQGRNYFGLLFASSSVPLEYEYYSWVMDLEEFENIEFPY